MAGNATGVPDSFELTLPAAFARVRPGPLTPPTAAEVASDGANDLRDLPDSDGANALRDLPDSDDATATCCFLALNCSSVSSLNSRRLESFRLAGRAEVFAAMRAL